MAQGFTKGTPIDTDPTLSLNSDIVVPSQAAVVTYVASQVGGKQDPITLTTTGASGASTFIANTLNVPNYTLAGLGGVPTTRTITIDGITFDLSADRSWSTTGSRQAAIVNMVNGQVPATITTFTSIATATPGPFNSELVRRNAFGTPVTLTRMTIITQAGQPANGNLIITMRVANADTALAFTIIGGSAGNTFVATASVAVGATDNVAIKVQNLSPTTNSASITSITTVYTI
jgi:hypothetical protein